MNDVVAGSRRELSMSSKPVLLALLALGPVLYISGDVLTMPRDRLKDIIPYSFVLYGLVAASWRAEHCHELAGRWCTIVTLIIAAWLGCAWLRAPGFVALLPLPVVLATALVSPLASVAVALTETALAVLSHSLLLPDSDAATFCALLAALWGSCGVAYGVVRPVSRLSEWVTEYYYRAQGALQDARQHKVELEQTLQAFAHANRQLALANERTAALRAIAEESQRAKAAFVGNVSHELRTPLNMIIGLVELMVRHPEIYTVVLSPKMRKDLETVHRNCEHLLDMINDVLDLSRVEAGRFPLHREPVSLQDVVRRSVAAVSPLLEQKQLGLLVTIPEELPPAYCDRTRIEQVILNLLSNAARYTQAGHIEVEVSYGSEQVLVRVTDTGPGIRPEDAQRVFDPFYQAASTRSEGGGSGLGLSISKQFVELHGGRMWLESKLGAGTSFYFSLPLSSNLKHVVHPWHKIREDWVWREQGFTSGAVASDEQLRRPRIVVGDDDGALFQRLLRYADGIELVLARGMEEMRQSLEECPAHAVLLNAATPEAGWVLAQAVVGLAPGTPTVVCAVPKEPMVVDHPGVVGYLVKPVTQSHLEQALRSAGRPVRHVLLVDDDPDALDLFQTMLHVCDRTLRIEAAASGKEALATMRCNAPDLVLLDVVMPDMSGWQLVEAMARDDGLRHVPVFFVSAQDPLEQPPRSAFLLATVDDGLSLGRLLRCSLTLSGTLLEPDEWSHPAPR